MDKLGCDALAASLAAGPLIGRLRKGGLLRSAHQILEAHGLRGRVRSVASGFIAMSVSLSPCLPARSEIAATSGPFSLGTVVNGASACSSGHCQISGGTRRGDNLFHRFDQFDTREISGVAISNGFATNIIMAVVGGDRARISSPIVVEGSKASLYFLSPKGISVFRGAGFSNVDSLILTTAGRIRLGAEVTSFDYAATTDLSASDFEAAPASDLAFMRANLQEGVIGNGGGMGYFSDEDLAGGIQIASGVTLSVDKSIVIVASRAPIAIDGTAEATRLEARGSVVGTTYGEGDGLAIVGQNITITGGDMAPVELRTNSQIDIREPEPIANPDPGLLASAFLNPEALIDDDYAEHAGTLSLINLSNVDFFGLQTPSSRDFSARIKAYGLGCFPGDCGLPEERSFKDPTSSALVFLRRIGRPAIFYEDPANPLNPENYGDFTNSGEADEAGRGVYAGMNIENIRFFVGAPPTGAGDNNLASARIKLEIGDLGGARASDLFIQAADSGVVSELVFGNNNERQALPSVGPSQTLFLNRQAYAAGDDSMYWFPSSDGYGTNSIRFISIDTPTPDSGSPSNGGSGINFSRVPTFDNVLLNVDQNVAEDFEAKSVQSVSTPSVSSRHVNLAPGLSLSLGLAVDEPAAPAVVSPSGSEAGVLSDGPPSDESRKAKPR